MRFVTLVLAGLLVLVHAELWFGSGGVPYVMSLRAQLAEQQTRNDTARERNARLAVEVEDLKAGLEMVEERARAELGMLKPNEILVHVTARR